MSQWLPARAPEAPASPRTTAAFLLLLGLAGCAVATTGAATPGNCGTPAGASCHEVRDHPGSGQGSGGQSAGGGMSHGM
jgi:hypothetical protein